MKRCLATPSVVNIPEFIVDQYNASNADRRLAGLLLFPAGVKCSNSLSLIVAMQLSTTSVSISNIS